MARRLPEVQDEEGSALFHREPAEARAEGQSRGSITPSVDIYNTVSLTHALPVGGEDIDAMAGDIRLGITEGGDAFRPLGEEEDAPTWKASCAIATMPVPSAAAGTGATASARP